MFKTRKPSLKWLNRRYLHLWYIKNPDQSIKRMNKDIKRMVEGIKSVVPSMKEATEAFKNFGNQLEKELKKTEIL